ncbi:MAG: hypothetical protein QXV46_05265 [Candidatus Bathyarchaeia archaeon]
MYSIDLTPAIERALLFIDSLRVDNAGSEYFEVAEQNHSEHRVYNQSQYLLSVMFKKLGRHDRAEAIRSKHPLGEPDNDPRRRRHKANDRFCILEGDVKNFYLANQTDSNYNDEIALLSLYWLEKGRKDYSDKLWRKIYSRYDFSRGVLKMDKADYKRKLYPVYKVALFGILAKRMDDKTTLENVQRNLLRWQDESGGWVTDRRKDLEPDGVANIETTALSIMALLP